MTENPSSSRQQEFDALREKLAFQYRGYRMEKMTEQFINALVFYRVAIPRLCVVIFQSLFRVPRFSRMPIINNRVFFSFPEWTGRRDYFEICDYVMNQTDDTFFFRLSGLGNTFAFNRRHLLLAIRSCRRLPGLGFLEKCGMAAVLYNRLLSIDEAEKRLQLDVKKYVAFSCVLGVEHLLTQYFIKRGIPTYNLQHGVTYVYEKNKQDSLEYTNMIADNHLAWGNFSRDEMIKSGISGRNVLVAGYPREHLYNKVRKPATDHCVVFLSRKFFNKANLEFLAVIKAFRQDNKIPVHFHLKLHPTLSTRAYSNWIREHCNDGSIDLLPEDMTLQQIMNKTPVGFCIAINSSAYYECYMHGVVTLRYNSADFDLEHAVADDLFSSNQEFTAHVQHLYGDFEAHFPAASIYRELQYVLGLPGNDYGKILNAP